MPEYKVKCHRCKGYGRVGVINKPANLDLFQFDFDLPYGEPCELPYYEVKEALGKAYQKNDSYYLRLAIKLWLENLDTVQCPTCNGTGISYKITYGTT